MREGARWRQVAWLRAGVRFAVLVAAVVVTSAQQPETPFRGEANYVRVDVYATRAGRPLGDLQRSDFELFDENLPQRIEDFRRIFIPATPSATVRPAAVPTDPGGAPDNTDARVFVLFLDRPHVDRMAAVGLRKPLTDALNRLISTGDLIAVMTPEMSTRDLSFVRYRTTAEGILGQFWGMRDEMVFSDPVEQRYADCYPGIPNPRTGVAPDQGIAQEMILRRREKRTLEALENLVVYLRGVRDERKAVLAITNGWRLYEPNDALARPVDGNVPSPPQPTFDPRSGRLTTAPVAGSTGTGACDGDRLALSQLDDRMALRDIIDRANRSNVSFYPVDPRGLAVFDEDIVPAAGVGKNPMVPIDEDMRRLDERHTSLRAIAEQTDGLAVVNNSNLAAGLQRIVDDLSAYYLLGYYSTAKVDGKFHAIRVRVKQPDVQLRTRRGYLALPAAEARPVEGGSTAARSASTSSIALTSALGALATVGRDAPFRVHAAAARRPDGALSVSVVAERGVGPGGDDWTAGGDADAMLVDGSGSTVASGRARIDPKATAVRVAMLAPAAPAGDYEVRVRAKGTTSARASIESASLTVPSAPAGTGSVLYRSGPTTGNKEVPTADARFRRSDRLRVDVPAGEWETATARLLDRTGKPLAVPVAGDVFVDPDGCRWLSARLALAPLAPGDYIIELSNGGENAARVLTAIRIVP